MIKTSSNRFVQATHVLETWKIVDQCGHLKDCGYTNENPVCECAAFGFSLHIAVSDPSEINSVCQPRVKRVTNEELRSRYAVHIAEQTSGIDNPTIEEDDFEMADKVIAFVETELKKD